MGRNADNVADRLGTRLAEDLPRFDWETERMIGATPVDVAGTDDERAILVELEWRRADPADNAAKLFRHVVRGTIDASRIVVIHLFTDYYALASGGVSSKRTNAEFVGRRAATTDNRVSYHPVTLALDPPKNDGQLPNDWRTAVDRTADEIVRTVQEDRSNAAAPLDQTRVAAFLARHDLDTDPTYHALDLAGEVGEIAADLNDSTEYGRTPEAAAVARDELGDAIFALLALCESLDTDADAALAESLDKYESRIDESGSPDSGDSIEE